MGEIVTFRPRRRPNPHGFVWLAPVDDDGGAWGIFHQVAPKSAAVFLGSRLAYQEAARFAQSEAVRLRASFSDSTGGVA